MHRQIKNNPSTVYSFWVVVGYLQVLNGTPSFNGDFRCEVAIPNKKISLVYHKEILQRMLDKNYDAEMLNEDIQKV